MRLRCLWRGHYPVVLFFYRGPAYEPELLCARCRKALAVERHLWDALADLRERGMEEGQVAVVRDAFACA